MYKPVVNEVSVVIIALNVCVRNTTKIFRKKDTYLFFSKD